MNAHGQTDPEETGDVDGNDIGDKLYCLLTRYGVKKSKIIITEVRNSILDNCRFEGRSPKIGFEDTVLEVMYRDYVASDTNPPITFIEYKSLVKIITDLSVA